MFKLKYQIQKVILLFFLSPSINAQYCSFSGEVPTLNLNGSKIVSQQFNAEYGFFLPKNIQLFFNNGVGVLGSSLLTSVYTVKTSVDGLGVSYLHPIDSIVKIGIELQVAYGSSSTNSYDFMLYEGGFISTLSLGNKCFLSMTCGIRNRSFLYSNNNSLELFVGTGWMIKRK